jgi:hypothetical protein
MTLRIFVSTNVVKAPDPHILEACDRLDDAIGWVIKAINQPRRDFGHYEAPYEARVLLNLLIRAVESLITLARTDLVLLPGAFILARTAFEISVRARWLLWPEREFEREARWLAHVQEEEDLWEKISKIVALTGDDPADFRSSAQHLHGFRTRVLEQLPKDVTQPHRVANLRSALIEQDLEKYYIGYALLSQFVHGGHYAGSLYRQGIGVSAESKEQVSSADWRMPFEISWWSLYHAAVRFAHVACEPGVKILDTQQLATLQGAIKAIGEGS